MGAGAAMAIDTWDEVRTAFHVARIGTVSGAAQALGVHHATVIRHIDALEARLGVRLFQRHPRGYTPTEAAMDLLHVARTTDEQFAHLASRLRGMGESVSGDLVVTTLATLSPLLAPVLAQFQIAHPEVHLHHVTGDRVFRLEYGEAHVAVRAGPAPEEPDNVVRALGASDSAIYAARPYLDAHGTPDIDGDLSTHRFVGPDNPDSRAPFHRWLRDRVAPEQVVFRTSDAGAARHAIAEGVGLGFLAVWEAARHPDLVQVCAPRADWASPLWIVTHMDLHRTAKVQAFVDHLKGAARAWTVEGRFRQP